MFCFCKIDDLVFLVMMRHDQKRVCFYNDNYVVF